MAAASASIRSTTEATCWVPCDKCKQLWSSSDGAEFEATLLNHLSGPPADIALALPALPAVGSCIVIRFCPDGFLVAQAGSSAASGVVLVPSAYVDVGAVGGDPCIVSVAGAFPTWSITFQFEGLKLAERFRQQVETGCLQVVSWMHHVFEAESRGITEPTCAIVPGTDQGPNRRDGPFLCGCYILFSLREDREHRLVQRTVMLDPSYCLRWMELRGPLEELGGIVELRFYNHHGPNAQLMDVVAWEDDANRGCAVEVAGHVIYFREAEVRSGFCSAEEVKPLMFLTFRSAIEAEAVADIATSALGWDWQSRDLLIDAQRRLQQPPPQQKRPSRPSKIAQWSRQVMQRSRQEVEPRCFVRADRDLIHRPSATLDAGALHWRNYYEKQREMTLAALAQCASQEVVAHHARSDTVVFESASGTVQLS